MGFLTGIICKFNSGWRRNRFGDRKFPCQQTRTETSRVTIFVRRTNKFYCFNRLFGTKYGQVNLVESRISLKKKFFFNFVIKININQFFKKLRFENDTCCKMNKDGTDVYFHVVNRTTGKVLPYQDEWVKRYKTIFYYFQ